MTITRVGHTSSNVDNNDELLLPVPAGTTNGDLLIFFGSCDGLGYDQITGFTLIKLITVLGSNSHQIRADYRVANNEPVAYPVFTENGMSERGIAMFATIRGQRATGFLAQADDRNETTPDSAAIIPGLTPNEDNSMVFGFVGTENGNNGNPIVSGNATGLTVQLDNVSGPGGTGAGSAAGVYLDTIQTTAQAVGGQVTLNNGPTEWGTIIFVIKEALSGGGGDGGVFKEVFISPFESPIQGF